MSALHPTFAQISLPADVPVRALFVQDSISALFASNRVAFLQHHFGVAVSAQVVDGLGGVLESATAGDVEAALRRVGAGVARVLAAAEGWRGVLFARHGGLFESSRCAGRQSAS